MNALDFLPFLGHSSIYPPFDEFLAKNGVIKRPNIKQNLDNTIFVRGIGLCLSFQFDISAKDEGFIAKSEGVFIFTEFEIMIVTADKKNGKYEGVLPYGLTSLDTRQSVEQKLGTPKRRNEDSDNYYINDLVLTVAFKADKLKFLQFDLPDNGWRERSIAPPINTN
jgi:hypothetical protein